MISEKDKFIILELVHKAILEALHGKSLIDKEQLLSEYPFLGENRAVFVTLQTKDKDSKNYSLRGCMGSILPRKPLIDDLIYNANSSAFHDPRFKALTLEEFENVSIEVSILSIPQKVKYKDYKELKEIIIPGKHGVILKKGFNRATFLPSVWEKLPDFDTFFEYLCKKARLNKDCLKIHPGIEIYTAEKISEND